MRTLLINMNADMCRKSPYYVARIVGEDKEGKKQLDNFIAVDEPYPVIVTIYGDKLLRNLSKELTAEFGNGFSYTNLKNMRTFYKTYSDEKGQTLSAQLPWSHNCLIMRVADPKAREWYLREAAQEQWSVRQLERNINSFYYQRQLENGNANDENASQCVLP